MSAAVVPSGADFAAASQAILPPAPVRFSTTKVLLVCSVIFRAAMRLYVSLAPPAEKGTRMRKARDAVCAAAAKLKDPSARARRTGRKIFISSVHEGPVADVEILAHGHVHEAAHAAKRPRDVALAPHVLGEDEVSRQAQGAMAVARLELEDSRGEENQLAPGGVVKILDVAFGRLAEKNRVAPEGLRHGSLGLRHRHLADLDRRVARVPGEYPDEAHARDYRGSGLSRSRARRGRVSCPPCAGGQGPSTFFMDDFPKTVCYT